MAVLSRRSTVAQTRANNREALVAAATELLEQGAPIAEISIEQIVRAAGLSRPTFYTYFADKRELILYLGQGLQAAVATAADPWLRDGSGSLHSTLAGVLDAFRAHRAAVSAIVEAATYDAEVNDFWHAFHDRFLIAAAERIQAANPKLPNARTKARAFALVWMTERTITELLAGADIDEPALLAELTAIWDQALG